MIAVIFEAWPKDGERQTYLDLAAKLRPMLSEVDGFISIERFQSLSDPRKVLSLSVFRDEAAVARWRNLPQHRVTQARGRGSVFDDYRIRVGSIERDYGRADRAQAPVDSQGIHGRVPL